MHTTWCKGEFQVLGPNQNKVAIAHSQGAYKSSRRAFEIIRPFRGDIEHEMPYTSTISYEIEIILRRNSL